LGRRQRQHRHRRLTRDDGSRLLIDNTTDISHDAEVRPRVVYALPEQGHSLGGIVHG
jgi:hypothetical protein